MSLKRKLATSAVALSAAAVPFLSTAPAMAMTDPNLEYFNTAVSLDGLVDLVATKPLCVSGLVRGAGGAGGAVPSVTVAYPKAGVDFTPTNTYAVKVAGATVTFIICTLT